MICNSCPVCIRSVFTYNVTLLIIDSDKLFVLFCSVLFSLSVPDVLAV